MAMTLGRGAHRAGAHNATSADRAVAQFVEEVLPRLIRDAETGPGMVADEVPEHLRRAGLQISAAIGRARGAAQEAVLVGTAQMRQLLSLQRGQIAAAQALVMDPDQLGTLFAVDHSNAVTTRVAIRTQVLAGGRWPDPQRRPAQLGAVAQSALGSVADYDRVDVGGDMALAVQAVVVSPLIAAVAELVDNALKATAHDGSRVVVAIQRLDHGGAVVTVTDHGVGMDSSVLQAATAELSGAARSATPAPRLTDRTRQGLRLVAVASQAAGFHVRLDSFLGMGTRCTLQLPASLVAVASPQPAQSPPAR